MATATAVAPKRKAPDSSSPLPSSSDLMTSPIHSIASTLTTATAAASSSSAAIAVASVPVTAVATTAVEVTPLPIESNKRIKVEDVRSIQTNISAMKSELDGMHTLLAHCIEPFSDARSCVRQPNKKNPII